MARILTTAAVLRRRLCGLMSRRPMPFSTACCEASAAFRTPSRAHAIGRSPAASAWTNWAARRKSDVLFVSRCTVGFETPDLATSFFASDGSYRVHGTLIRPNHAVFAGGMGVQLAW